VVLLELVIVSTSPFTSPQQAFGSEDNRLIDIVIAITKTVITTRAPSSLWRLLEGMLVCVWVIFIWGGDSGIHP
jgi:hypothetical protein